MKSLITKISLTAIFISAVLFFSHFAFAALVITPSSTMLNDNVEVNCTNDAHYYGIYRLTTKQQDSFGECDDVNVEINAVGNYIVAVTTADQDGVPYYNLTIVESANVQITPNFIGGDVSDQISGSNFTVFLSDFVGFLTSALPELLVVLSALIGLGFLITRVRRWIGKKA